MEKRVCFLDCCCAARLSAYYVTVDGATRLISILNKFLSKRERQQYKEGAHTTVARGHVSTYMSARTWRAVQRPKRSRRFWITSFWSPRATRWCNFGDLNFWGDRRRRKEEKTFWCRRAQKGLDPVAVALGIEQITLEKLENSLENCCYGLLRCCFLVFLSRLYGDVETGASISSQSRKQYEWI